MSAPKNLNPQRGFRDLYPEDKNIQNHIFDTLRTVASLHGFQMYDGPILEDISIYLDKTSPELIERQTFRVIDKNDQTLVLRPEMTPSLARMVAKKANELTFPIRYCNIGLRFRYEAPQKGREREFYQADFDILGSDDLLADAEIIATAVNIFRSLGATEKDFVVYLNSRSEMEKRLIEIGYAAADYKKLFDVIDRQDKISKEEFIKLIGEIDPDTTKTEKLIQTLSESDKLSSRYFTKLFMILEHLNVAQYCQVNYNIVRGLDYYTGLVFEVKAIDGMKRSFLGGGRYDNLVTTFDPTLKIPGVGFATSDVVLMEFIQSKNLVQKTKPKSTKILITLFNTDTIPVSCDALIAFRTAGIPAELFTETNKKMDKQLKYADKYNIPYALIIGPDEVAKNLVVLKNLTTHEQQTLSLEDAVNQLKS